MSENTTIYWVTLSELELLHSLVINHLTEAPLDAKSMRDILTRVQTEISVSQTRNESSIFPSDQFTAVMDLPDKAIPLRLSNDEVKTVLSLPIPKSLEESFR